MTDTFGLYLAIKFIFMILIQSVLCRFDGDKYKYEYNERQTDQQPEIIGEPTVLCTHRFMIISVQTARPLLGRIYVEDREYDERCSSEFTSNNNHNSTIRIPILPCLIIDESKQNNEQLIVWAHIRINFHQVLITAQSRLFRVQCSLLTKSQLLDDAQQPGTVNTICRHSIQSPKYPFRVGGVLFHEWTCSEEYDSKRFMMLCRECSVISRTKSSVLLIDEFGCIVDNNLINNLHNDAESKLQKYTAISQVFKFPGESDIRFRCKILLVPRSTIENSTVKIPKCTDFSNEDSRTVNLPDPNSITFPDQIETMTLTDWIKINESEEDEALFESSDSKWTDSLFSLNDLYNSRDSRPNSRYSHKTKSMNHLQLDQQLLLSTEIADLQPIDIQNYEDSGENNTTKHIWHIYNNGNFNLSEINEWIRLGNRSKEWHLKDLILNQTDESLRIFAHSTNNSKFNLTFPLQNKINNCSTRMLNLLLLLWSIFSTIAWLIILAYKICKFLLNDYGLSSDEIDERFVHEPENTEAQLYMPWLDRADWKSDRWNKPNI